MEIYKDLYRLESILLNYDKPNVKVPKCYFFCITNNQRYINRPRSGLRKIYSTYDGYKIKKGFEYKYIKTKTGNKFFKQNGGYIYTTGPSFDWTQFDDEWFLKIDICT